MSRKGFWYVGDTMRQHTVSVSVPKTAFTHDRFLELHKFWNIVEEEIAWDMHWATIMMIGGPHVREEYFMAHLNRRGWGAMPRRGDLVAELCESRGGEPYKHRWDAPVFRGDWIGAGEC